MFDVKVYYIFILYELVWYCLCLYLITCDLFMQLYLKTIICKTIFRYTLEKTVTSQRQLR